MYTIPEPHLFKSDTHLSLSGIPCRCHSLNFSFVSSLSTLEYFSRSLSKRWWMLYFLILRVFLLSRDKYLLETCFATIVVVGAGNTMINDIHNPYLREVRLRRSVCCHQMWLASFLSIESKGHNLYPQNSYSYSSLIFAI